MRWSREVSRKITKLYLTSENMTEGLKEAIVAVAPNYPQKYFNAWFQEAHQWKQGIRNTSAGPGTDYFLGYLDTAKELGLNISLIVEATENWRPNNRRERAIKEWLTQNT